MMTLFSYLKSCNIKMEDGKVSRFMNYPIPLTLPHFKLEAEFPHESSSLLAEVQLRCTGNFISQQADQCLRSLSISDSLCIFFPAGSLFPFLFGFSFSPVPSAATLHVFIPALFSLFFFFFKYVFILFVLISLSFSTLEMQTISQA